MDANKKKLMNFALLGSIFSLAWPTMLEEFMQTAVQYIDTAMVGSLGTQATAAVGSTTTVNWLIGTTISAFGVGFLSFISQSIGAGDLEKTRRLSAQAITVTLCVGSLFTVIVLSLSRFVPVWMRVDPQIVDLTSRYFFILYSPLLFRAASIILGTVLRAAGDTKTPMFVGILVNCINVVLNFFLIYDTRVISLFGNEFTVYGAGMGVIGAGLASAISIAVGGFLLFVKVFTHKTLSPRGCSFAPDKSLLIPCVRIAVPNLLQRFCTSLGYVVFASMINSLGTVSTAAHTVANTVESAFYVPGYGMMAASATLTGISIGENDAKKQKDTAFMIIILEVIMMVISGGLLFIFARNMASIFATDNAVIRLSSTVLRMVAVSEPFYGIAIVVEGMFQGMGDTKRPFRYNVFSMWVLRILGTELCINVFDLGLVAAWGCMIANNLVLFMLFFTAYRKVYSKL